MTHPNTDELFAWLTAPQEARQPAITEHVHGCERCTGCIAAGAAAINRS